MRGWILALWVAFAAPWAIGGNVFASCEKPWVFFDLGDTLVDTKTNHYHPMFYQKTDQAHLDGVQYPTAKEYIDELVRRGFTLGLVIDVPAQWGQNYPEEAPIRDLMTARIQRTMDFTAGLLPEDESSWEGTPMDWTPFGHFEGVGVDRIFVGRMFLPQRDNERKSKGSLVMFQRAVQTAARVGCTAVYMGESPSEMELAERAGMSPYWVGSATSKYYFLPVSEISAYAENYVPGKWKRPRLGRS